MLFAATKCLVFVRRFTIVLALVLVSANPSGGDEPWNRFRGPNGSGISTATTIPVTWTDADYLWQVELPTGASSPVVWEDKIFVTGADVDKLERSLLCYSATDGKQLWARSVPFTSEKKHARNSYATNTPTVDAKGVYTLWQSRESSQLIGYRHDGGELWRLELGPYSSNHGGGISPIVADGIIALNLAHEGNSFLLAVDASTGKEHWRIPRTKSKATYSTPCVLAAEGGKRQLIFTSWKQGITAVDLASGTVLWEQNVFEPEGIEKRAIGSPVTSDGLIYGTCGYTGGKKLLVALDPSAKTESGEVKELFRSERNTTHMPSTLVFNGRVFNWTDSGVIVCLDAKTGKTVWQARVGGNYSGSPICIDSKLYCLSEDQEMVVIAAADEFQELARIKLDSGSSATPAVSNGVLYFRTDHKLYALGRRGSPR